MNTGMTQQARQAISEGLSRVLADTYALYLKTQNFHWNVTGSEFFSLHLLFEKQYEELAGAVDEIAERIRALGFYVEASFSSFKEKSSIPDDERLLSAQDMLESLVKGHESFIREARKVCIQAEKEQDGATVDLLGKRLGAHEKIAWFLRSHI